MVERCALSGSDLNIKFSTILLIPITSTLSPIYSSDLTVCDKTFKHLLS